MLMIHQGMKWNRFLCFSILQSAKSDSLDSYLMDHSCERSHNPRYGTKQYWFRNDHQQRYEIC